MYMGQIRDSCNGDIPLAFECLPDLFNESFHDWRVLLSEVGGRSESRSRCLAACKNKRSDRRVNLDFTQSSRVLVFKNVFHEVRPI